MVRNSPEFRAFQQKYLNLWMRPDEQKASEMAEILHEGQTDHSGEPYINHPRAVTELMQELPEYQALGPREQYMARIVALLHDTLEDTIITAPELREAGFSWETVAVVEAVTARKGEPREEYYERVKAGGPVAVVVKLGDLAHNNMPDRREGLPGSPSNPVEEGEEDRFARLGRKYFKAYTALGSDVPDHLHQFSPEG